MNFDIEDVLARIASGESQAEIARSLNIGASTLSERLSATPEIAERSARARSISAEAWLDRGLDYVLNENNDANRARIVAQECARRAALRNPAYREKQAVDLSGDMTTRIVIDDMRSSPTKQP